MSLFRQRSTMQLAKVRPKRGGQNISILCQIANAALLILFLVLRKNDCRLSILLKIKTESRAKLLNRFGTVPGAVAEKRNASQAAVKYIPE